MVRYRHRQVAAHRSRERHRIEWLGQYALGAERNEMFDLAALRPGGQKHNRDVGSPWVLAQVGKRRRP